MDICHDIESMTLQAGDVCLVSVPSFAGRVPQIAIERLKKITANGAKAVLNCVYGNREWNDTLTELQDTLEACGFVCVAAIAAVAEHSIFRQFATGRPDGDDAKELTGFAHKITAKLKSGVFGTLNLAGSHGIRNTPTFLSSRKQMPAVLPTEFVLTVARSVQSTKLIPHNTDKTACISCMRCRDICPKHARDLVPVFMQAAAENMAAKLGGHKVSYLFYNELFV